MARPRNTRSTTISSAVPPSGNNEIPHPLNDNSTNENAPAGDARQLTTSLEKTLAGPGEPGTRSIPVISTSATGRRKTQISTIEEATEPSGSSPRRATTPQPPDDDDEQEQLNDLPLSPLSYVDEIPSDKRPRRRGHSSVDPDSPRLSFSRQELGDFVRRQAEELFTEWIAKRNNGMYITIALCIQPRIHLLRILVHTAQYEFSTRYSCIQHNTSIQLATAYTLLRIYPSTSLQLIHISGLTIPF